MQLVHALSIPGAMVAGGTQGGNVGKLAGSYSNCPEVRDLFLGSGNHRDQDRARTSKIGGDADMPRPPVTALVLAEALMGRGLVDCSGSALSAQIAFRFPEPPPPLETSMPRDEDNDDDDSDGAAAPQSNFVLPPPPPPPAIGSSSSLGSSWHTDGLRQGRGHPFR